MQEVLIDLIGFVEVEEFFLSFFYFFNLPLEVFDAGVFFLRGGWRGAEGLQFLDDAGDYGGDGAVVADAGVPGKTG